MDLEEFDEMFDEPMDRFSIDKLGDVQNMCLDIADFHERFGLMPEHDAPRHLPADLAMFRGGFMQEELDEYKQAVDASDLEKQFDALIDLVYVALGTAFLQNFPFAEGWRRVHDANMKKIRATEASQSKRNHTCDVVKPEGWEAPVLRDLVQAPCGDVGCEGCL